MLFEVLGLYEHVQEESRSQCIVNYRAYISTLVNANASEVERERASNKVLRMNTQKKLESKVTANHTTEIIGTNDERMHCLVCCH